MIPTYPSVHLLEQAQADAEKSGLRHELETEHGAAAAARREAAAATEQRAGLEVELREERSASQRYSWRPPRSLALTPNLTLALALPSTLTPNLAA